MRLTVFGATGGTGRQLVRQALTAGHDVAAFARRPEALALQHSRLTVVEGDVLRQPETVEQAVTGAEAVVSALGVHRREPTTVYSAGTAHIVQAMHAAGVSRLVCVSSAGVVPNPAFPPVQSLLVWLIVHWFHHVYADMAVMEHQLRSSGLDWTIIRAPGMTNGLHTGNYASAVNQHLPRQRSLSRADIADYILGHLHDPETHQVWVELAGTRRRKPATGGQDRSAYTDDPAATREAR